MSIEKNKNSASDKVINLICLTFGVNKDWILNKSTVIFDKTSNNVSSKKVITIDNDIQASTLELMKQMPEENQRDIFRYVMLKRNRL